jgi:6-phosphofructokinase 1
MSKKPSKRIAVLTSGGDAPGMNSAVRSVVRAGLERGLDIYAIYEGYQGMVDGGDRIRKMDWNSVSGILSKGGTAIGTARCDAFRTHEGRRTAAKNLLKFGIDALVVIGGDGSLTGANLFRQKWPALISELAQNNDISQKSAENHANLSIVGLVGSIDNDMFGTDMTIGADTALHRITEAVDALSSTAASHQRTFVVKVMGRNCGYLALMSALATGADWVIFPEFPPEGDDWEMKMVEKLKAGRSVGKRDSIVILAEGARDRHGNYIGSTHIQEVLQQHLNTDVRVTVLGHVQRGGSPSAFDRILGTLMGWAAVDTLLVAKPEDEPLLIGLRGNRVSRTPLMECVKKTHAVANAIELRDYKEAMALRGTSYEHTFDILRSLSSAVPKKPKTGQKRYRIAVLNAGGLAPGMNPATRTAIRIGADQGHIMLGVHRGFDGLINGEVEEMSWMSVAGWSNRGGSELGTTRTIPKGTDFYAIARTIEKNDIQGLLIIGGYSGYESAHHILQEREHFPAFNIPIVCLPATINNNIPGSELSIGSDTALNNIVQAVDKIKQSAVASNRCFIVELMGRYCGYLSLMGGLASGAERVYLHETGVTLRDLQRDIDELVASFRSGTRVSLIIRNEFANQIYTTNFMCDLFEEESQGLFDVRPSILGHLQQGGDPSPFDRVQAIRFAVTCIDYMVEQLNKETHQSAFMGMDGKEIKFHPLEDFPRMVDSNYQRPKNQWWMDLLTIANTFAQSKPSWEIDDERK